MKGCVLIGSLSLRLKQHPIGYAMVSGNGNSKLISRRAYFLYLVEEGKIDNSMLGRKMDRLKRNGYLKVFLGEGKNGKFYTG